MTGFYQSARGGCAAFLPGHDRGIEPHSILEVFMQAGLYGGFGTTEAAAACAHKVFKARGRTVARCHSPE